MQDTNFLYLWRDTVLDIGPSRWKNQSAVRNPKKLDVYTSPRNDNFSHFNIQQTIDINQCVYNYYISNVIANTKYLLVEQEKNYFGYDSMASCWEPSQNLSLFHRVNSTKYGGQCYQDPSFFNLYIYSVKCRYWFEKQFKQFKSKDSLLIYTYSIFDYG